MTPPVFAHGHLRLYLLSLLAERPQHGYELIQALGERFGGTYVPSAGTIYPRLAKLQDEGLVTKQSDGRRSVYAITETGLAELDSRRGELDGIENELTDSVRRLADEVRHSVDDAMRTLRADLAAAAQEARTTIIPEPDRAVPSKKDESRAASRQSLHEADAALATFRAELRGDLRARFTAGTLRPETVELLTRRLDEVRREVAESLRD